MKRCLRCLILTVVLATPLLATGCIYAPARPHYGAVWVPAHWSGPRGDVWIGGHWR